MVEKKRSKVTKLHGDKEISLNFEEQEGNSLRKPKVKKSREIHKEQTSEKKHPGSQKRDWKEKILPQSTNDKKIPARIMVIFFFSLVFFLFALYKAFIYGQGYRDPENIDVSLLSDDSEMGSGLALQVSGNQIETGFSYDDQIVRDSQLIQDFYAYLTNNQITEMNELVDRPLKNSVVWANHWNRKNIHIFTKHLSDTVELQDIFLIPNSMNEEKHTRQYSYILNYTIQPGQSFQENWEVTLVDREKGTLISAIMCKTEGCSHSPFFWPQNYGLK